MHEAVRESGILEATIADLRQVEGSGGVLSGLVVVRMQLPGLRQMLMDEVFLVDISGLT